MQTKTGFASSQSKRHLELACAVGLASLLVGVTWFLSSSGGAVGIARADDWSYLLTQFEFARTGRFVLNNWAVTMLIGQTLLAAPVVFIAGPSVVALQGFVAILSIAALVTTYVVVRQILPTGWAAFSILTLAVSPVFGPSVVSFMTDVPALFFLSLSLLMGIRALRSSRISWGLMAGSGLAALVAFTFRDYAILGFPVVVLVAWMYARKGRDRLILGGLLAAILGSAFALYFWRHSLPNDLRLPGWDFDFSIELIARGTLTIALLVSPSLAAIAWWRVSVSGAMRSLWIYGLAIVAAIGVLAVAGFELLGNVIHPYGSTWLVSGNGIRMWPLSVNRFVIAWAVLSLALAFVLFWKVLKNSGVRRLNVNIPFALARRNPAQAVLVIFPLTLLLAHSLATLVVGTWYIDRYFILVVPFLSAAILRLTLNAGLTVKRIQLAIPLTVLAAFTVVGIHVVDFHARFDGARAEIGRQLEEQGYRANEIDAGMQWVSFHGSGIGVTIGEEAIRPGRNWWTERYPEQRVCITVTGVDALEPPLRDDTTSVSVSTIFGRNYVLVASPGPDSCL